ncbi:MAG: LamG-like jellyroll fold domain-containing protein [Planctomycetota bacterium]
MKSLNRFKGFGALAVLAILLLSRFVSGEEPAPALKRTALQRYRDEAAAVVKSMTESPRDPLLVKNVNRPDPVLMLWHRYDELRDDVLDFSGNGNMGEFLDAPRIPTRNATDQGLRLLGEFSKSKSLGYFIMKNKDLVLHEGMVCLWVWVDEEFNKSGIVLTSGKSGKDVLEVKQKGNKASVKCSLLGNTLSTSEPVTGWFHLAVTFDANQSQLWINGKKSGKPGASGVLDLSEGFWVGTDDKQKKGLAGAIEDLKIYNKAREEIDDAKATPSPDGAYPPSGLIVHYDFEDKENNPGVIKDRSGNGLDGICTNIRSTTSGVAGKMAFSNDKNGWSFSSARTANPLTTSYIVFPKSPLLNLKSGTMILHMRLDAIIEAGDPRSWLMGFFEEGNSSPAHEFDLVHRTSDSFVDASGKQMPSSGAGTVLGPIGRGIDKPRPEFLWATGTWVKIVISWSRTHTAVWINDMRHPTNLSWFWLQGDKGAIVLGSNAADKTDGFTGVISDFRIYSFQIDQYAKTMFVGADEEKWWNTPFVRYRTKPR